MSNNIWGYQGLQTPLENLTRGNYNVADYTNMRKEFNARLLALENVGGFQPNNVTMTGFLHLTPGTGGSGSLTTQGSATLGSTLSVASTANFLAGATINSGLTVGAGFTCNEANVTTSLTVGGLLTVGTVAVDNVSISGDIDVTTATVGTLSVEDITASGDITAESPGKFVGDGSSLTGVLGTDATKLPLTGGTLSGTLSSNSSITTSANITTTGTGKFVGDGSLLTNLPSVAFTGGTLTSTLTTQNVIVQNGYNITGNGSPLSLFNIVKYDQTVGQLIEPAADYSKHFNIILNYQETCTVSLRYQYVLAANFPDQMRFVTITKKGLASIVGGYSINLTLPIQNTVGWTWNTPEVDNLTGTLVMGNNIFSYTFLLQTNGVNTGWCYLVNKVTV